MAKLKAAGDLKDVDTSYRLGAHEFQVHIDDKRAAPMGVSTTLAGAELRILVEGQVPVVFRESGREYDIRVRLNENERNLKDSYQSIYVPNVNQSLVRLPLVSNPIETQGYATINVKIAGALFRFQRIPIPAGVDSPKPWKM